MRIFVTGGTGFVATYLIPKLIAAGHAVVLLTRSRAGIPEPLRSGVEAVEGDPLAPGEWWAPLADCDAAVNLVGESIQGRWTIAKQERIRQSRLLPLAHLIDAIPREREFVLLSASAVGYYGNAGEKELDESAPPGDDFLAELARDWEAAAHTATSDRCRVATMRFGMVLGAGGGALPEIVRAMRRFMGGILGSGRQWVSWIHQEDLASAVLCLLGQPEARGAFNFGSPHPIRQGDFARTLGHVIHRPAGFPTPPFAIRMAFGGFADAVLFSQRMQPRALTASGFEFRYPELEPALVEIMERETS